MIVLKCQYQGLVNICRNGHLVSRASDYIIYSVEAAVIDSVIAQYGPCTNPTTLSFLCFLCPAYSPILLMIFFLTILNRPFTSNEDGRHCRWPDVMQVPRNCSI